MQVIDLQLFNIGAGFHTPPIYPQRSPSNLERLLGLHCSHQVSPFQLNTRLPQCRPLHQQDRSS
jgi:hypothetical protein